MPELTELSLFNTTATLLEKRKRLTLSMIDIESDISLMIIVQNMDFLSYRSINRTVQFDRLV